MARTSRRTYEGSCDSIVLSPALQNFFQAAVEVVLVDQGQGRGPKTYDGYQRDRVAAQVADLRAAYIELQLDVLEQKRVDRRREIEP